MRDCRGRQRPWHSATQCPQRQEHLRQQNTLWCVRASIQPTYLVDMGDACAHKGPDEVQCDNRANTSTGLPPYRRIDSNGAGTGHRERQVGEPVQLGCVVQCEGCGEMWAITGPRSPAPPPQGTGAPPHPRPPSGPFSPRRDTCAARARRGGSACAPASRAQTSRW